jgi:hypothetical protein
VDVDYFPIALAPNSMSTVHTTSNTRRHAQRPVPLRRGDIHPLLKAVRITYRAQRRPAQHEPTFVRWAERLGRLYLHDLRQLADRPAERVLRQLEVEQSLSSTERAEAQDVLAFVQDEVLQSVPS